LGNQQLAVHLPAGFSWLSAASQMMLSLISREIRIGAQLGATVATTGAMIWSVDGLMPRAGCASFRVDSSQNYEPDMCDLSRRGQQPIQLYMLREGMST
jgi:hypothetical protein